MSWILAFSIKFTTQKIEYFLGISSVYLGDAFAKIPDPGLKTIPGIKLRDCGNDALFRSFKFNSINFLKSLNRRKIFE